MPPDTERLPAEPAAAGPGTDAGPASGRCGRRATAPRGAGRAAVATSACGARAAARSASRSTTRGSPCPRRSGSACVRSKRRSWKRERWIRSKLAQWQDWARPPRRAPAALGGRRCGAFSGRGADTQAPRSRRLRGAARVGRELQLALPAGASEAEVRALVQDWFRHQAIRILGDRVNLLAARGAVRPTPGGCPRPHAVGLVQRGRPDTPELAAGVFPRSR